MGSQLCCQPDPGSGIFPAQEVLTCGRVDASLRACLAARAAESGQHPIVTAGPDFSSCIRLINAGQFRKLPTPWPRCQDLPPSYFVEPQCDSLVVAVSHGWFYQAHPDPTGAKAAVVKSLLDEVTRTHNPSGHTLCFVDFCSIPQRPFRSNQEKRSEEEKEMFTTALTCMPNAYLMADAVLHVEMDLPEAEEEELVQVDASDLGEDTRLMQMGENVQVYWTTSQKVRLFDVVVSCDSMTGLTSTEVGLKMNAAKNAGRACPIELRRMPYGLRNDVPVGDRGWIYLERFATMVKGAMVDESDFDRVCFSNSQEVLDQIRAGSAKLRKAALQGEDCIKHELNLFYRELDQMHFRGTSTDKILGTAMPGTPRAAQTQVNDRDVVANIMREMVLELPTLWSEERKRQVQRRLVVAVNSGDAQVVDALLNAGADVNYPGKAGETCLHRAALQDTIDVARVLLKHGADVGLQDAQGNCPGHNVFLMMSDHVVDFVELLCPNHDVMMLKNSREVTPLDRFQAWALTADNNQPYKPAMAFLDRVQDAFPLIRTSRQRRSVTTTPRSLRSIHSLHQTIEVDICGHTVQVDEWAPNGEEAQVHVLWLCFGAPVPPCMQRAGLERIVKGLNSPYSVKLFALTRIGGLFRGMSMGKLQETLLQLLGMLPLNRKFVFVDDSKGVTLGMLPKLRHRLLATFLINPHWCVPDEFLQSAGAAATVQHFLSFAGLRGDLKKMAKGLASLANAKDAEVALGNEEQMLQALEEEDDDYLDMVTWMCELLAGEWASCMGTLHREGLARPFNVPAVVACGALAPEGVIVQSALRLQSLFANSEVSYIANSRVAYQMEDEEQMDAVQGLLEDLLRKLNVKQRGHLDSERSIMSCPSP